MAEKMELSLNLTIRPVFIPQRNIFLPGDEWISKVTRFMYACREAFLGSDLIDFRHKNVGSCIPRDQTKVLAWKTNNIKLLGAELRALDRKWNFSDLLKQGTSAQQIVSLNIEVHQVTKEDVDELSQWAFSNLLGCDRFKTFDHGTTKKPLTNYHIFKRIPLHQTEEKFIDIVLLVEDLWDSIFSSEEKETQTG